jgi:hypothetical protein
MYRNNKKVQQRHGMISTQQNATPHSSHLRIPSNPLPPNNPPHPDLTTPQISKTETLHPTLLLLSPLFPGPDLFLGAIPIDNHSYMCRTHTDIHGVRFVHRAVFTLQLCIAEGDDITRADLVELLDGGVGEIGINQSAVSSVSNRFEGVGERVEKVKDQGVGAAIADDVVLFRGCGFRNACAVFLPCSLELVLTEAWRGRFVSLFKGRFLGVLTIVADCDDGLAVVDEEDVNIFGDGRSAATSLCHVFLDFEQNVASVLESWRRSVGICPPKGVLSQIDFCRNMAILRRSGNIHTATHVH